jgi:hypothetical protein
MLSTHITNLSNQQILFYFVSVFTVLYLYSFIRYDNVSNFFILSIIVIGLLINNHNNTDNIRKQNEVQQYVIDIEQTVVSHSTPQMVLETVYKLHKPLKSLRFIKNNNEATQLVYYLRFLMIYDREGYLDFIICLEYFLKLHFNIMIGKYDIETNFVILKDIRYELLNALQTSTYNIPNISKVFDGRNLDERIKTATMKVQALTYRYVKIVYKKYHDVLDHKQYKGTREYDPLKNDKYHMY